MWHMLSNLIKRCRVTGRQTEKNFITAQTSYMGFSGISEIVYPYGLKAHATAGSPGISLSIQANEDNRIVMPYAYTKESKLPPVSSEGEVLLGSPVTGSYIWFKKDGSIEIKGKITFLDDAVLRGKLNVQGDTTLHNITGQDATFNSATIAGSNYSTHVHGGVTSGTAITGTPQ